MSIGLAAQGRRRREIGARPEARPGECRQAPLAHGGRLVGLAGQHQRSDPGGGSRISSPPPASRAGHRRAACARPPGRHRSTQRGHREASPRPAARGPRRPPAGLGANFAELERVLAQWSKPVGARDQRALSASRPVPRRIRSVDHLRAWSRGGLLWTGRASRVGGGAHRGRHERRTGDDEAEGEGSGRRSRVGRRRSARGRRRCRRGSRPGWRPRR
jgi:hypothetical protein